jgi:TonB family protein
MFRSRKTKIVFMNFDGCLRRFSAFGLALSIGWLAAAFFYNFRLTGVFNGNSAPKINPSIKADNSCDGCGRSGADYGPGDPRNFENLKTSDSEPAPTTAVQILAKPRARYTNEARAKHIQGTVVLRVTFKADRTIGGISVISGLPDGLNESAIAAAKELKFEPARRNGMPYSVTRPVEYFFIIF